MPEFNFDGLVGPTHNYAGLSPGNVASLSSRDQVSNPKAAALQGLAKMRFVRELGVGQGVLMPQSRPSLKFLREVGFRGSDEEVLSRAAQRDPQLLRLAASASSMWAANAATVAPSRDTLDRRVHFVPANLAYMTHRSLEAASTHRQLSTIFSDPKHFAVHSPLPAIPAFCDEGAANHTRLHNDKQALHLLAWGYGRDPKARKSQTFPARQTEFASQALGRLLNLAPEHTLYPQQHPEGIEAGAFHTDVLAVGNATVLLLHPLAFCDSEAWIKKIRTAIPEVEIHLADPKALPVQDAVASYPFNSQLVTLPDQSMAIVAPLQARENPHARRYLESALEASPTISALHFIDVTQSMNNGGGPACLRLRVFLEDEEQKALSGRVLFDPSLDADLQQWVQQHYRDRLRPEELRDPQLWREQMQALDELCSLLRLPPLFDFQTCDA